MENSHAERTTPAFDSEADEVLTLEESNHERHQLLSGE
jgi:hypothetical protein